MSFQVLDLHLYHRDGRRRSIQFRPGAVNIITGGSKTGKSALSEILDYCLGSGTCRIPAGVIRESVEWVGVRLQGLDQALFVGRKLPDRNDPGSSSIYHSIGATVAVPDKTEL